MCGEQELQWFPIYSEFLTIYITYKIDFFSDVRKEIQIDIYLYHIVPFCLV